MFLPWFKDHNLRIHVALWVLEIPIMLLWAKMYFKTEMPTAKKGFYLGVFGLIIGLILDSVITVPFFVKSYALYYGNWLLYVGFAEMLILTTFAGWEFDGTFSKA